MTVKNQYHRRKYVENKLKQGAWAVLDSRGRLLYEPGEFPRFKLFRTRLEADVFVRHGTKGIPAGIRIVPVVVIGLNEAEDDDKKANAGT